MGSPFLKRTWRGVGDFLRDMGPLAIQPVGMVRVAAGRGMSADFRERLMLVVTGVNDCRYCTFLHRQAAHTSGVPDAQISQLLSGRLEEAPAEQQPALRYALEWAEGGGRSGDEAWAELVVEYGLERARLIELVLRMIRVGNMSGNSLDAVLHWLSRGRW